jgi:hypothetical protein
VSDHGAQSGGRRLEVQMGGAQRGASGLLQEFTDRSVVRDRVRGGGETPERLTSLVIGEEMSAARRAVRSVLHVVKAVPVGFPYVESGSHDRYSVGVGDGALDPAGFFWGSARRPAVSSAASAGPRATPAMR